MTDYTTKSYGRNAEISTIFKMFSVGKDISMHGPRRLGKTFVLDRLVEQADSHGFICLKIEVSGCSEPIMIFRKLCEEIAAHRSFSQSSLSLIIQRMSQVARPRGEQVGPWYQPFLSLDWEAYLERLLSTLQVDKEHRWVILIDELPIFLKALHDRGAEGIKQARDFMNLFSRLRSVVPNVRWLITGSIGITPLAQAGQYMGVLSKFENFPLEPLDKPQAIEFLQDLPQEVGMIQGRTEVTTQEALAIVEAVGWRAAYYLEALALQLPVNPETNPDKVQENISISMERLLKPHNSTTFGTWEEHLRKHHSDNQRDLDFRVLNELAVHEKGLVLDALLTALNDPSLNRDTLRQHLLQLINEGFLYQEPFGDDTAPYRFRLALLRQWWQLYRPQATI